MYHGIDMFLALSEALSTECVVFEYCMIAFCSMAARHDGANTMCCMRSLVACVKASCLHVVFALYRASLSPWYAWCFRSLYGLAAAFYVMYM